MKVLLTTLNAKYIHSCLALRYLEKYCAKEDYNIIVSEYTINDNIADITAQIYEHDVEIIGFSCYIWNIRLILEIADRLKKVKPELIIILGGPEVSFTSVELMKKNNFIDFIIKKEGEEPLKQLLNYIAKETNHLKDIPGLVYRDHDQVKENKSKLICDLNNIPRPYRESDLEVLRNKIIYYETTRGCPFNCSYCLSSTITGLGYFSLARVKKDLLMFIKHQVKMVKFVDRTFNADKTRAMEIFNFLVENRANTTFHFELAADLLDKEIIDYLKTVPDNLFRFEIGVQSTNEKTLEKITRKMDITRVVKNVQKLKKTNIPLHLDLIVGLAGEDYISIQKSFNDVYQLNPDVLQLGFLKLLKGSKIRKDAEKYAYKYSKIPPYEIIQNKDLSYQEIINLKRIEDILEKYHNSGAFKKSLKYITKKYYHLPFDFFADLAKYFKKKNLDKISHSRQSLYDILYQFYQEEIGENIACFSQYLLFDLLLNNRGVKNPTWVNTDNRLTIPFFKEKIYSFLKSPLNINSYLPHLQELSTKKILAKVSFQVFNFNILNEETKKEQKTVILFDYVKKVAYDITDSF